MELDLDERGFGVVPLLPPTTVAALRREFERLHLRQDHEFYSSNAHSSRRAARAIDLALKAAVTPAVQALLPDHEPFLAAFISKGCLTGAEVEFHQDWTYTDERSHRAVAVWIPLVDVDDHNGALRLVPGSHRGPDHDKLRVSGIGNALEGVQPELAARCEELTLDAGSAVVYDPAVAHGSRPNRSGKVRPAVAIAFAPRSADLVHFHLDPWARLQGYRVDEAYFTQQTFAGCPRGYPAIEPWAPAIGVESSRGPRRHLAGSPA